jgi:uncharacterized membrane protein YfcA
MTMTVIVVDIVASPLLSSLCLHHRRGRVRGRITIAIIVGVVIMAVAAAASPS